MEMKVRALLGAFVMLSTMWLAGCGHYICGNTFGSATCSSSGGGISQGGGGNGAGFKARFYFVDFAQAGSTGGMAETELNGTAGTFSAITTFTAPALPTQPTGLVIVNKKFMYVPSANGILVGYSIDMTTGFVKEVPNSPYAVVGGTSIASNSTGTLIFVGDVTGQRIFVFAVNADGSLTAVAGSPFSTSGVGPAVMATDGHSKFLYITEGAGSPLIAAFSIGTNGTLSVVPGEPFSFNMSSIVGDPSGKYLLGVTGQAADNHIHVFGISSSTGAIAEVSGSPFATAFTPISLAVHPNGGWVYSFNEDVLLQLPDPVEGFQLNATTGTLTEFAGSPFTSVKANGGVIEPSGKYLFALGATIIVGNGESTVTPYAVDSSGHLSSPLSSLGFPGIKAAAYAATDAQ
jgi:6-phosphogluconolactonase (cycloisomerase 2 family)